MWLSRGLGHSLVRPRERLCTNHHVGSLSKAQKGGFTRTSFVECCFMKYVQFARALQEADSSLPVDFSEHQIHGPDNSNCIGQQMSSTELVHSA